MCLLGANQIKGLDVWNQSVLLAKYSVHLCMDVHILTVKGVTTI